MKNHIPIIKWATDYLISKECVLNRSPEIVVETPWSNVILFTTTRSAIYLKQTPPSLFLSNEPKLIELLYKQFQATVPVVIAINNDLHCFLMEDAGTSLRETLKADFKPALLCQAINQYAALQRQTENSVETFLKLGTPDWRLDKLPTLYDQLINQTDFLKAEGLLDRELKTLQDLSPKFLAHCKLLAEFRIPETIGYHDFQDKNVLISPNTKRMTFVDWGETAIIHPFFSLYTCIEHAIIHHEVKEDSQTYQKLQEACFKNWLGVATKKQLLEAFILAKRIRPIWETLASYQFMLSVDQQAFKAYYPNKPSPIAEGFRKFTSSID